MIKCTGELDYASLFSRNTTDTKQNCKNNVCFQTSSQTQDTGSNSPN